MMLFLFNMCLEIFVNKNLIHLFQYSDLPTAKFYLPRLGFDVEEAEGLCSCLDDHLQHQGHDGEDVGQADRRGLLGQLWIRMSSSNCEHTSKIKFIISCS